MPTLDELLAQAGINAEELLTQPPQIGGMPGGLDPSQLNPLAPPAAQNPLPQQQPAQPNRSFLRNLLTDFVGTLAGSLESGAAAKAAGRGAVTRAPLLAAASAVADEQEKIQQLAITNRIHEAQLKLQQDQELRQTEQLKLNQDREARIGRFQQQQLAAQLARAGMRITGQDETGQLQFEPIPEAELPADVRERILTNRNLRDYRNALAAAKQADQEYREALLSQNADRIRIAFGNLQARRQELDIKAKQFEVDIFGTVGGAAVPGMPTDPETGAPMGLRITRLLKMSPEERKLEANVDDGLDALAGLESELGMERLPDGRTVFRNQDKLLNLAIPFSIGARQLAFYRDVASDVITRLRTGAALNKNEEKFYKGLLPTTADLTEPRVIETKIRQLRDFYQAVKAGRIKKAGDATRLLNVPRQGLPIQDNSDLDLRPIP